MRFQFRRLSSLALFFLLTSIACIEQIPIDLVNQAGSIELDPGRLRPDFETLGNQPRGLDRLTYSDGNVYDDRGRVTQPGGAPLSPLVFADIEGDVNDQLRRAECLWVGRDNESARISFEMIAYDVDIPELNGVIDDLSGCGGFLSDPDLRGIIEVEDMSDGDMQQLVGEAGDFYDVDATIHTGRATRDPFNGCDARDPGIANQPMRVVNLGGLREEGISFPFPVQDPVGYPFCMNKASLPRIESDWTLQLDMISRETGSALALSGANSPSFVVPTRIKVVEPSSANNEFLISRPLRFYGPRDSRVNGDRTVTPIGWTWATGIAADGRWIENFSPNLAISRIRVFRDLGIDPDTGEPIREYLSANHIDAYSQRGLQRGDRELRCDVKAGNGEDPAACFEAVGFTPTYRVDRDQIGTRLSDRLTWVVEFDQVVECQPIVFPDGTMDCDDVVVVEPPIDERDTDVYIEFHLVRPGIGTNRSGLMISPPAADLGDVEAGREPVFQDTFELHNWGQGNMRILDVAIEGPHAAEFEVVPDVSTLMGRILPMGGRLPLSLQVRSGSRHHGRREATLRVTASDVQGSVGSVRAYLRATVVDWIFEGVHPPFAFFRHAQQHPWDDTRQWQKVLLILNSGSFDMPRGRITITGPGADHWSITREVSEHLAPEDYIPWIWGEEPAPSETIPPGGSEVFYLVYHPNVPYLRNLNHGPDEAEVRIQVDDAEYRFPVRGYCVDRCQFNAPKPAAPPSHGGGAVKVIGGSYAPPAGPGGLIEPQTRLGS